MTAGDALFTANAASAPRGNRASNVGQKASDATRTPSTADHGSAKNRSFDALHNSNAEIAANYVNDIAGSITRQGGDQSGRPAAFDSNDRRRAGNGSDNRDAPKKNFAEQRAELMSLRRQAMQARFDSAKEKAGDLFK